MELKTRSTAKEKKQKKLLALLITRLLKILMKALIHQLVTSYMNNGRTGTRSQKTRA